MNIVRIGGVTLPHPTTLSVSMQDLDSEDATRNERGVLQRDRIRAGVYKLELSFVNKKGSEIKIIENAIRNSKLTVTFPDSDGMISKSMYVGDRKKDITLYDATNIRNTRWTLSFNLVEY